MKKTGLFLAAAIACATAFVGSVPAAHASGACSQQGFKVQIKGVWHKVVRVQTARGTRLVNCGPAW